MLLIISSDCFNLSHKSFITRGPHQEHFLWKIMILRPFFDFFCTKKIWTPDSLPHSWGYFDKGGTEEVQIPPPSCCNIGSKMGKIALFVKNNDPEAIFDFFCTKKIWTPDSLPHLWGSCDMGGTPEVHIFYPFLL